MKYLSFPDYLFFPQYFTNFLIETFLPIFPPIHKIILPFHIWQKLIFTILFSKSSIFLVCPSFFFFFLQITSYISPNLERFQDNHAQEDMEKPVGWCARKYDPPWHEFTCKRWLVLCARGGQTGSYGYVPMQARLAGL